MNLQLDLMKDEDNLQELHDDIKLPIEQNKSNYNESSINVGQGKTRLEKTQFQLKNSIQKILSYSDDKSDSAEQNGIFKINKQN